MDAYSTPTDGYDILIKYGGTTGTNSDSRRLTAVTSIKTGTKRKDGPITDCSMATWSTKKRGEEKYRWYQCGSRASENPRKTSSKEIRRDQASHLSQKKSCKTSFSKVRPPDQMEHRAQRASKGAAFRHRERGGQFEAEDFRRHEMRMMSARLAHLCGKWQHHYALYQRVDDHRLFRLRPPRHSNAQ